MSTSFHSDAARLEARGGSHAWTADLWSTAIENEWLIDLREWKTARGASGGELPRIAFTRGLWDALERLRFADLGRVDFEQRVAAVLTRARVALDRVLEGAESLSAPGEVIDFGVPLGSCRRARLLRLHVEIAPWGQLLATVGLADEFVHHPIEDLDRWC